MKSGDRRESEIVEILTQSQRPTAEVLEILLPILYDELRALARNYLAREPHGITLQPTALVHEAYLRLVGRDDLSWANRAHFFSSAAISMRRILVEHARSRARVKRGGGLKRVDLDVADPAIESLDEDLLALDEALGRLESIDPRASQVVMLRHFAGLTAEETASVLDVSVQTVATDWRCARAWLLKEVAKGDTTIGERPRVTRTGMDEGQGNPGRSV